MKISTESTRNYLKDRYNRAMTDTMYLVDKYPGTVCIVGSTGNLYHVGICERPRCTCKDSTTNFVVRGVCKHILYVFCILGKTRLDNVAKGYVLPPILDGIKNTLDEVVVQPPSKVRYVYDKVKENYCDICKTRHENNGDKWKYGKYHETCLAVSRKVCLQNWMRVSNSPLCPVCGEEWNIESMENDLGGYLNFNALLVDANNDKSEKIANADEIDSENIDESVVNTEIEEPFNLKAVETRVISNWNALLSQGQKEKK